MTETARAWQPRGTWARLGDVFTATLLPCTVLDMGERPSLPALGEVLLGKYSIVRVLGKGAMGIVFEAVHIRLSQRVAIKMVRPSHRDLPEILSRFEREARAAAQLQNTHVTRVMDVDVLPDGTPFMVMEHLEGRDLRAELKERGPLPIPEAVTWMLQACEALREAHRLGIVHRDIKPSNLFLARAGEHRILKVLDFGISKLPAGVAVADETSAFSTFGTPRYMSPEQMRSARYVDGRTDIWSLGVVLYQLLTGRTPFAGENAMAVATSVAADAPSPLQAWRPDVPEGLESAVMTALVKNVEGRFQDIEAFARALAPFAVAAEHSVSDASTVPATASTWSKAAPRSTLRQHFSRWLPIALPGIALLSAGILAMAVWRAQAEPTHPREPASKPTAVVEPSPESPGVNTAAAVQPSPESPAANTATSGADPPDASVVAGAEASRLPKVEPSNGPPGAPNALPEPPSKAKSSSTRAPAAVTPGAESEKEKRMREWQEDIERRKAELQRDQEK